MSRKKIALISSLLLVIAVASVLIAIWRKADETQAIKEAFATAFNRNKRLIHMNLPPADGRYPGAVFVEPEKGQVSPVRRQARPASLPASYTDQLIVRMSTSAQADFSRKVLGHVGAESDIQVLLIIDELRVFENDLNEKFKQDLLEDKNVYQAHKNGLNPRAVTRSYEGIVTYRLSRSQQLSGESWGKLEKELIKLSGELGSDGEVYLRGKRPEVIAYELVDVRLISDSLSSEKPVDVEFNQVLAEEDEINKTLFHIDSFGMKKGSSDVRFTVLGNSEGSVGDLNSVAPSMNMVADVLTAVGAKPLLSGQMPSVLSETELDQKIEEIANAMLVEKPELQVVYFMSHAIAGQGGQLYLLMQDFKGDPIEALGQDLFWGHTRTSLDHSASPLSGSNINELLKVVTALQVEAPAEIKGLYPVSRLYKKLDSTNVPFLLLIDGCYGHREMAELREALYLTNSGNYVGPNLDGGPEEVKRYHRAIRQFAEAQYLKSENPVIFSAAPGTLALIEDDPRPNWSWSKKQQVGPLAKSMYSRLNLALLFNQTLSWGDFFNQIVDVKLLGEMQIKGHFSGSDFARLSHKAMIFSENESEQDSVRTSADALATDKELDEQEPKILFKRDKVSWGLVTIGSFDYVHLDYLNDDRNNGSAKAALFAAEDLLTGFNPNFHMKVHSTQAEVVTDKSILDKSIDLNLQLFNTPVDHLVVYCTSQMLFLPDGETLLLLGNVNKDFAERAMKASRGEQSQSGDGLLLLQTLFDAFTINDIPVTFIIDTSYNQFDMQDALMQVMDQKTASSQPQSRIEMLSSIVKKYPYLKSEHAVILASVPGKGNLPGMAKMLEQIELDDDSVLGYYIDSLVQSVYDKNRKGYVTWSDIRKLKIQLGGIHR